MNRYLYPLIGFLALLTLLFWGLGNDPRFIPSPFINKPAPQFSLPELYDPSKTVSPESLKGKVWILNVFASWCTSCVAEHEVVKLIEKSDQVKLVGLNYKDKALDAKHWLQKLGNPYDYIAFDLEGNVGIDWGVYGVPETFIIDKKGIVRHKFTGPLTHKKRVDEVRPLINKLLNEAIE